MFHRLILAATSAPLLRLAAVVGVIGWVVGFAAHLATLDGLTDHGGEPIGGDFMSFYTAGSIVLEGRGEQLYASQLQQTLQRKILRDPEYAGLSAYLNPPSVAVLLAPLAALPYFPAYLLCTGGLLACFLTAFRLLGPHLPALRDFRLTVVGLAFLFYPLAVTVTGGQNTAVSLLLLAATYHFLRHRRAVLAGLALGLLLYKPQLALPIILLLALRRQFVCVGVAASVAVGHYLLGAALCGPAWPLNLLAAGRDYWSLENLENGARSISLIGVCDYSLPVEFARVIGPLLAALVLAATAWSWRRADPRGDGFDLHWAAAIAATVLVSPHTQWHDSGLLVLPVLLVLNHRLSVGQGVSAAGRFGLLAAFALTPFFDLGQVLGFQPLVLLPLLTLLWIARQMRSERPLAAVVARI